MLNFVQLLSLLFTITMRLNISAVQHSLAVSLLTKGCSQHKIQTRTGLGKGTVGKINDEVERNNKNHSGGCSSKLSTQDSHTILCQITIEKLNNAVQATKCINSIIFDHFLSQTVRKHWKRLVFTQQQRRKFLCWRLVIDNKGSSLQNIMKIGL